MSAGNFISADFTNADLSGANLDNAKLENAIFCKTIMPSGEKNNSNCK